MATVFWTGNAITVAQLDTLQVTAVALNGTVSATINGKTITYTCTASDTTTTAATALFALLQAAAQLLPEFGEVTWANPSAGVVTATAATPGTPFTLTVSSGGGATITITHTTASSSPSDVGLAANWLRAGVAAIPVNGDDVIVADSSVSLLWNLSALSAVQFNTFSRWQNFTGTIGLPENNTLGYYEYRPTYFKFSGPGASNLPVTLGYGAAGGGPSRERYDVGGQRCTFAVLGSGGAADRYAVRILGTNALNQLRVVGTSVGVAMLPGEAAAFSTVDVDGGGTCDLGAGVSTTGAVTYTGSSGEVRFIPGTSLVVRDGSTVTVTSNGSLLAALTARNGATVVWNSDTGITTLTLETGSVLDRSGSLQAMNVTSSTLDGDTCQVLDPNGVTTYTNATTVKNTVNAGPFVLSAGRTIKVV